MPLALVKMKLYLVIYIDFTTLWCSSEIWPQIFIKLISYSTQLCTKFILLKNANIY